MKQKDKERLQFMAADIKKEIRRIEILVRKENPGRESETRIKLNQLWLAVHDLEYYLAHS